MPNPLFAASKILSLRFAGYIILIFAVAHLAFQAFVLLPQEWLRSDQNRDMAIYYQIAQTAQQGQPLYNIPPNYGPHRTPFYYLYPPHVAAFFAPVAQLDFSFFSRCWTVLLFAAFWAYSWSLAKIYRPHSPVSLKNWLIAGLCLGILYGAFRAISLGQIDPLLWALFGSGLAALASRSPSSNGVYYAILAWTLATLVKPFFVWPLLILLTTRLNLSGEPKSRFSFVNFRWMICGFLVAVTVAVGVWVSGWQSYIIWARDVVPLLNQGTFSDDNFSLSMAGLRLAENIGWRYSSGPLPVPAKLWLSCCSVCGPLAVWYLFRRRPLVVVCALSCAAAILCAPICWSTYLPLLLAPLTLMLSSLRPADAEKENFSTRTITGG